MGAFTAHDGLILNVTKARAYNTSGDEIPLSQVKSVCSGSHCSQLIPESTAIQPSMTISPTGGLTIGAIIPLHRPGDDIFNCGPIDEGKLTRSKLSLSSHLILQISHDIYHDIFILSGVI